MSFLDAITPVILTYNEEANIARVLARLTWARDIVVVDSFSTDATLAMVRSAGNARLFQRRFDTHAGQWNFSITETGIGSAWILALDADYVLSDAFVEELRNLQPDAACQAYQADFVYCVLGRPLRGSLYPRGTVLFKRGSAHYVQAGHTQRLVAEGTVCLLKSRLLHDDRKSLARWFASQRMYARLEAEHLLAMPRDRLRRTDRIRLLGWAAPLLVFFYTLLVRGCILDGWAGWHYVLQRTLAEILIALELLDRRLRKHANTPV